MMPILILAIAGAGYFFGTEAAEGEIIAQNALEFGSLHDRSPYMGTK